MISFCFLLSWLQTLNVSLNEFNFYKDFAKFRSKFKNLTNNSLNPIGDYLSDHLKANEWIVSNWFSFTATGFKITPICIPVRGPKLPNSQVALGNTTSEDVRRRGCRRPVDSRKMLHRTWIFSKFWSTLSQHFSKIKLAIEHLKLDFIRWTHSINYGIIYQQILKREI